RGRWVALGRFRHAGRPTVGCVAGRIVPAPGVRVPRAGHHRRVTDLAATAPAFVAMAHRIVWATVATVDEAGRPRSRILHPMWEWDGESLVGWIATGPTPVKRAHLDHSPYVSVTYWAPDHDTATAEC